MLFYASAKLLTSSLETSLALPDCVVLVSETTCRLLEGSLLGVPLVYSTASMLVHRPFLIARGYNLLGVRRYCVM